MENLLNQIGIVVSGCKNGYSQLAAARFQPGSPLPEQGVHDLRLHLRVSEPGRQYFSMRVLGSALVLTACRSSVDSVGSTGGYIAVSLFVPHTLRVEGATEVFTGLLDAYWGEFMHPVFGSPLPGKLESAAGVEQALGRYASHFHVAAVRYRVLPSTASAPAAIMPYGQTATVDAVMANPYHAAYARYSDVVFVERALLDSTVLSRDENLAIADPVATLPSDTVDCLHMPPQACFTLEDYKVNGTACPLSGRSLLPTDRVSFTLRLPDGSARPFEGSVREAVARRLWLRDGDRYRVVVPPLEVKRRLSGIAVEPGKVPALARGNRTYAGNAHADGIWSFTIPCADFPYDLVIVPAPPRRGKTQVLKRAAVTADNVCDEEITVLPAPGSHPASGLKAGVPRIAPRGGAPRRGFAPNRTVLLVSAVSVFLLLLIGVGLWIFFGGEQKPSDAPADAEDVVSFAARPATAQDTAQGEEEPEALSEHIYLVIPVETQRFAINGDPGSPAPFKYMFTEAFVTAEPPVIGSYVENNRKIKVIRLDRKSLAAISDKMFGFVKADGTTVSRSLFDIAPELRRYRRGVPDSVYVAVPRALDGELDAERFRALDMAKVSGYEPLKAKAPEAAAPLPPKAPEPAKAPKKPKVAKPSAKETPKGGNAAKDTDAGNTTVQKKKR